MGIRSGGMYAARTIPRQRNQPCGFAARQPCKGDRQIRWGVTQGGRRTPLRVFSQSPEFPAGQFLDLLFQLIGGHGGQLKQMILKIKNKLADGGCIVFNSVSTDSLQQFKEGATEAGMNWTLCGTITLDDNNSITTIKAE